MSAVSGLGFEPVTNPLDVPPAADYFGAPQYGIRRWNETTFFEARRVTARRHPAHTTNNEPSVFDLVIGDEATERVFTLEVLHGCSVSVTQVHDNLNGLGWDLPRDTILLNESPVRITAATGEVGYGHLERSMRLDHALRTQSGR